MSIIVGLSQNRLVSFCFTEMCFVLGKNSLPVISNLYFTVSSAKLNFFVNGQRVYFQVIFSRLLLMALHECAFFLLVSDYGTFRLKTI